MTYDPQSLAGTTLLHYVVIEKLGEGGMGLVYKARDTHLDRLVALKVLPAGMMADSRRKRRFVQEARAASALNHPNIITIHDVANDRGIDLIVMEFVAGRTLDKLIRRGGLQPKEVLTYAIQVADAMAQAHSAGILHRDLKPSNIMVTKNDLVKVLDFGLAKLTRRATGAESSTTKTMGTERTGTLDGMIAGTPAYMSPEQAKGRGVDARSDIFSFGAVLYEMITGTQPFRGDDPLSILSSVIRDEPEKITALAPLAPIELERVIVRALHKDPESRWQSMADLKFALTNITTPSTFGGRRQALEMASILFVDIAKYSLESMDRQTQLITMLQTIVRGTEHYRAANSQGDLISLPTGDGMALVFFHNPVLPVQCALEIARAAKQIPGLNLRMGLHSGPVYRHADINDELNVVGSGINTAQRIMDAGDAGHILVSSGLADVLAQVGQWNEHLVDFGEHSVKHGGVLHFYSLRTDGAGNPAWPSKWERPDHKPSTLSEGKDGASVASAHSGLRIDRRQLGIGLAMLIVSIGAVGLYRYNKVPSPFDSVAVLPFINSGSDPEMEYLSDGITENLINTLSQLQSVSVRSRSSVYRYKGHAVEPKAVGQKLQVRTILMGSVSQRNGELTISAELVETENNRQIWGQKYNRRAEDLLSVQREISQEIAQRLRTRLSGDDEKELTKHHTESPEAYLNYMKGRFYWYKRTEAGLRKAAEHFEQAIKVDPGFALAYAGLADTYSLQSGLIPPTEIFPKAKRAALEAIRLDRNLSEGYAALAFISFHFDWDWVESEKSYRRAIDLNPNYPYAHSYYARYLSAMRRFNEAIVEIDRALRLDPLSLGISTSKGVAFYQARQYDRAIDQQRKTIEMESGFAAAHSNLAEAYMQKGRLSEAISEFETALKLGGEDAGFLAELSQAYARFGRTSEARRLLDRVLTLSRQRYVPPTFIAMMYGALGEKGEAFYYLDRGYSERCWPMAFLSVDPLWDPLRSDPRFSKLLKRIGL